MLGINGSGTFQQLENAMKKLRTIRPFIFTTVLCAAAVTCAAEEGLRLHPENPHYFLWRGKPAVLITSGEHYGAVLNRDFDYVKYLDTLSADGLNLTRTWTGGTYCEPFTAFNISENTLAPKEGKFLCPFARSDKPGYRGGGNKFDLERWDDAYFARFRDFVKQADKRGVIVEVNLFCPFYEDSMWVLSPLHPANNVNGIGAGLSRTNVYTMDRNGGTLAIQEKLVRKLVEELRDFGNAYFEICNEPYFGGVTSDWQRHIAEVIQDAQKNLPDKKLISQNIANGKKKISDPDPNVSIFNFHYATPPDTVGMNYQLNKVIGDNETGFKGQADAIYRKEAWEFILAGGGLFNNLDYSFTAGHEDGTFQYPAKQPGGGSVAFRKQMHILAGFMNAMEFVKMKPDNSIVGELPAGANARALVEAGRTHAIYLRSDNPVTEIELKLPEGDYNVEWTDTRTGAIKTDEFKHPGGSYKLAVPPFEKDIALRITLR
jgi:hypothetical protein